jgi:hypothetical protein
MAAMKNEFRIIRFAFALAFDAFSGQVTSCKSPSLPKFSRLNIPNNTQKRVLISINMRMEENKEIKKNINKKID